MKKFIFAVAITLLATLSVTAQTGSAATTSSPAAPTGRRSITLPPAKANPVTIPKFDQPPTIDGRLDDAVWQKAAVLGDFYQIQPGDNIAPSRKTEVLLGYDSKTLYIAYHCYDEPGSVRATVPKRDQIFDDDYVGALFDTFNDQRRAYEIDINPLGVQADGIWDVNGNEDFSYDMVFESKGSVTSDGYVVEIAIPFKSLRYNAGEGQL